MLRISLFTALVVLSLAGCSSPAPEASTTEAPAAKPAFSVASDNVVRNDKGEAYCVVMNQVVSKEEEATMPKATQDGVTYIFCCKSCPGMFEKDPAKYAVAKK